MESVSEQPHPFRFGRRAWLVNVTIWTLLAILTAAAWVVRPGVGLDHPEALPMIGLAFVESYLWAVLTPPMFFVTSRFSLDSGNRAAHALLIVSLALLVAFLVTLPVGWVYAQFVPVSGWGEMQSFAARVWATVRARYPVELLSAAAVATAGVARDYSLRYQARRDEAVRLQVDAAQLRADSAQLRAQLSEARLAVLRAQLDPHFLFNTLNAASALMEKDPAGARRMIARLSELLRHALKDSKEHEVRLSEELKLLQQYLEIMEIRYQGRLYTSITVEPEAADALLPSLILQPFAENAMKHGVSRARGHGRVDVHAGRLGDHLVLTVQDTGPGNRRGTRADPGRQNAGEGIGLRNTRARLEELYGTNYHLELRPTPEGGMVVEILLPFRTPANRSADAG